MRAMILSAGYGTRLWPLTEDRTKPALPILGKPLVGYVAEYLAGYGWREVVVNLHHRPESVRKALGDGSRFGVSLNYVEEPVILGTSGALDNARQLLDQETFVVINGKIITDIDLTAALETHRQTGALATLILLPNVARERFSIVETAGGLVQGFAGMPARREREGKSKTQRDLDPERAQSPNREPDFEPERVPEQQRDQGTEQSASNDDAEHTDTDSAPPLMFTGIQIMEPSIFDYIPRGVFSHSTTDVYPQAIAKGERIAAHVAQAGREHWYELSTIERYLEVSLTLLAQHQQNGQEALRRSQQDQPHQLTRNIYIGAGSTIDPHAEVSDSILWDNVTVEGGAVVNRAVLGDGVRIRPGDVIENAAVVRAALVAGVTPPEKALKGELKGENFVVSLTQ